MEDAWWMSNGHEVEVWTLGLDIQCCSTDQDSLVYIVVDKVGAPYRVLLYQPGIRFIHSSNSKGLCLQHLGSGCLFLTKGLCYSLVKDDSRVSEGKAWY